MKEKVSKDLVAVVIPIYKKELCELELRSLKQAYAVLNAHLLIIVKPESLDLSEINSQFPLLTIISFDDYFFSGIKGYNQLMLSSLFYERFLQYQYILIYQLDAYVFRDELVEWCLKGYDYIGAPWLKKKIYEYPLISTITKYLHQKKQKRGEISKYDLYNKIGNGGFSLRKVESHFQATKRYKEKIDKYISHKQNHLYNEDVFFATEVSEFLYPNPLEALSFSFDKYPFFSYRLTNSQLPFGCHGWYKRKMKKFWKPIIGF
ncbi:hypothetical protein LJC57_09590 [Parabacteroides sp. OttesenSCG-928-G07]|nr:hypothetical protein [Parabacteroides sp. OttesenSCG-928-G21]MDL2278831.1 hypothetical protein [Parabacteroides sp. OttesenSCG-928-G07]